MTDARKMKLKKYGITVFLSGLFSFLYVYYQDFGQQTLADRYRILCDAFSVPGMMLVLFGLLLTVSGEGALDGLAYGMHLVVRMFTFRGPSAEKYSDYLERRRGKRAKGFGFLYVVGLAFLAIAMVFLCLFYSIYQH